MDRKQDTDSTKTPATPIKRLVLRREKVADLRVRTGIRTAALSNGFSQASLASNKSQPPPSNQQSWTQP